MKANQAELTVRSQCETLQVSISGHYGWLGRGPSKCDQANVTLSTGNPVYNPEMVIFNQEPKQTGV